MCKLLVLQLFHNTAFDSCVVISASAETVKLVLVDSKLLHSRHHPLPI